MLRGEVVLPSPISHPGGQFSVFITAADRAAQLYSWALGSSGPWECHFLLATWIVSPSGEIFYVIVSILALVILLENLIFFCVIILPSVAWLAVLYFSTLSHYRPKFVVDQICVLIFSTIFVWNISHSEKNSIRHYDKYNRSSFKVSVILDRFY